MAIDIPADVFNIYNEAVQLFIRKAKLIYPAKREECPNCYVANNHYGGRSTSKYKTGGPDPFSAGMTCPVCHGRGYKEVEASEEIDVRIYWDRRSWTDVGIDNLDLPNGAIQTIGYMSDLGKIEKAKYLVPQNYGNISNHHEMKFQRVGTSYPQGFKQNPTKYVVTFWEMVK
jgi:hypothetical protein